MVRRHNGYTLIELLVTIAIIGMLAGMVFPVFARTRESAHRAQCLSNVKSIAVAITMYLSDWDEFFPVETDKRAAAYFNQFVGLEWPEVCDRARLANPYLREPVVLDEYLGNRDVWRCPSARAMSGAESIVPAGSGGFWLNAFRVDNADWKSRPWSRAPRPCKTCWPSGWGGKVTDSFAQGQAHDARGGLEDPGVFIQGIAVNDNAHWIKHSTISDAVMFITCGDGGATGPAVWSARGLAFPDLCMGSSPCGLPDCPDACTADYDECPWSESCGLDAEAKKRFYEDQTYRARWTRHLGGSNLGFLDGHAKWYDAETIIFRSCPWPGHVFEGDLASCCWYPSPCE
jgi:prepilin-type N-terminal cleavage/methylation domain-containing protein/prepilin-type processing-associated H-X9-DG protein